MAKIKKEYTVPLTDRRVGREQLNKDMAKVRQEMKKGKKE